MIDWLPFCADDERMVGSATTIRKEQIMDLKMQLEQLYRNDRKKLLSFIRQRVKTQEEAEDILHDVFANVLAAAQTVDKPIENVASWVYTAVRNRIIDSYRKKKADAFSDMLTPSQIEDGVESFENIIGDESYSPDTELVRKTIWEEVQKGLAELPPEQRWVFEKNEFEGVSFREMSEQTGVNINTLLARKRYAVLHLRKKLGHLYEMVNNASLGSELEVVSEN
ncbi:MAG: RNA polymerase sigma factor [Bacteroidota bacterium]|nr:RNA polymerase sigma factor [Candidatus Kapabacteria bacterium]MCS7302518.1 RNA polymerase sigma factor [Candidatus Kapabacteria bacterium]MCX7937296.1 RNA polymerase sigma factor [Chlorobiota bacterium]MDW8075558.1 RNA polymerase sigma factor [Bacteroidota bacterium]MDW8271763.1 RNA polymerase sigma factor [Bacteroidota bacterium]